MSSTTITPPPAAPVASSSTMKLMGKAEMAKLARKAMSSSMEFIATNEEGKMGAGYALRYGFPLLLCGINPVLGFFAYDYLDKVIKNNPDRKPVANRILEKNKFKKMEEYQKPLFMEMNAGSKKYLEK